MQQIAAIAYVQWATTIAGVQRATAFVRVRRVATIAYLLCAATISRVQLVTTRAYSELPLLHASSRPPLPPTGGGLLLLPQSCGQISSQMFCREALKSTPHTDRAAMTHVHAFGSLYHSGGMLSVLHCSSPSR